MANPNFFGGGIKGGFGGGNADAIVLLWNPDFPNAFGITFLG